MANDPAAPNRAVVFIDGNNWYHALKLAGVTGQMHLSYPKIAKKLVGPREWRELRYYVGQVQQTGNTDLYASQRQFFAKLTGADDRVTLHTGRLETRPVKNKCAEEILEYLGGLQTRIDRTVHHRLLEIAKQHRRGTVMVEKAVDVMIAVDMVVMAERDKYDTAYLLSADGDFTPVAKAVRAHGKKIFAVCPSRGAQLAAAVDAFIPIDAAWFIDCFD